MNLDVYEWKFMIKISQFILHLLILKGDAPSAFLISFSTLTKHRKHIIIPNRISFVKDSIAFDIQINNKEAQIGKTQLWP